MNKLFKELNYDICFYVHVDDFYELNRFEKQIKAIQEYRVDIVSSNFYYMSSESIFIRRMKVSYPFNDKIPIKDQLNDEHKYIHQSLLEKKHNIIAHPCCTFTKNFWLKSGGYGDELPVEDFNMMKRALKAGLRFHILPEFLLFYRIHENQTCKKMKGKK